MKPSLFAAFAAGAALTALLVLSLAAAPATPIAPAPAAALQDADAPPPADGFPSEEEMRKLWAEYSSPGPAHGLLERFLGTWKTTTTSMMMPAPIEGTTTYRWLLPGRFIIGEGGSSAELFGSEFKTVDILGYDKFKHSYVCAMLDTMDTNLLTAEGDLTPDGKSLIVYGTLDEYLTGEHDKMVKYAWRFPSEDKMILEVHDLPIGETNTKVVETVFTRQ